MLHKFTTGELTEQCRMYASADVKMYRDRGSLSMYVFHKMPLSGSGVGESGPPHVPYPPDISIVSVVCAGLVLVSRDEQTHTQTDHATRVFCNSRPQLVLCIRFGLTVSVYRTSETGNV